MKWFIQVYLLAILWPPVFSTVQCPQSCRCLNSTHLHVNCSRLKLKDIPLLPATTTTLDLSGNRLGPALNDSDVFVRLTNLTHIDLSENGLQELQGCLFRGLAKLRGVLLMGNRLTRLPDNFFTDSKEVEHLDLSHNLLTQLPSGVMSDLPRLKILKVSHNDIRDATLAARFQVPKDIEYLDLSHNSISNINEETFDVATQWSPLVNRTIKMRFCSLQSIQALGFSKIPSLTALDLTGNPGVTVQNLNGMLKNLQTSKRLQELSLAEMNLGSIDTLFTDVTEIALKFFNLSHNGIEAISNDVFQNLPSLQVIDASFNRFSSLNPGFKNLHNLRSFNMSHNRLSSFTSDNMGHLTGVTELDISNNLLDNSDSVSLAALVRLEVLDVSNNSLPSLILPMSTAFLRYLDYRNNRLDHVSAITETPNLQYFDVSGNAIIALPNTLFSDNKFLKVANFSGNSIVGLQEHTFVPQSPLVVDLSHNNLTSIGQVKWVATQTLILKHNKLTMVDPHAFSGMSGLAHLDLSNNKLIDLDNNVFQHHVSMKYLDLSKNQLSEVYWPSVLRNLENLHQIDLSFNRLTSLPENMFERLSRLEIVYLQNNDITTVTPMLFRDLSNLRELDMSGNAFDCTCDMLAFRDWLKRMSSIVVGLWETNSTVYRCHSPSSRAGVHITQWDTGSLECNKSMLYAIVFGCIGVGLLLMGAIASSGYRFYRRRKKARDEWKRKLKDQTEEERKRKNKADYIRMVNQEAAEDVWRAAMKRSRRHDRYQVLRSGGYASDSATHDLARRQAERDKRYRNYPERAMPRQLYTERPSIGESRPSLGESDYINLARYYGNRFSQPSVYSDYRKNSSDNRIFYTADSGYGHTTGGRPYGNPWQEREGWEWATRRSDPRRNGYTTVPERGYRTEVYNDHYQPQQEVRFDQAMPKRHSRSQRPVKSRSYSNLPLDAQERKSGCAVVGTQQPGKPHDLGGGGKMGRTVSQPYIPSAGTSEWL